MDGQSEYTIQTLEQYLWTYVSKSDLWDEHLGHAEFAYNSAKSASTGFSPFEIINGCQPNIPLTLSTDLVTESMTPSSKELVESHHARFKMVQDALVDAQKVMAEQYDKYYCQEDFDIGDLVYLDSSHIKECNDINTVKFLPRFRGPFKILAKPSRLNYLLDLPSESKIHPVFHVSRLRRHYVHDSQQFADTEKHEDIDSPLVYDDGSYYQAEYEVERILRH
jgi:hypothetical protein